MRGIDRKIEDRLSVGFEESFGGLSKGGFLNAGMLFGSIPAREVVRNTTGSTLAKGAAVRVSGDSSGTTLVALADSDADATMPAIGILEDAILNNANGMAIKVGRLDGLDTSAWAVGTVLYVSGTAGGLTSTAPSSRVQPVAVVVVQHASTGAIEIFAGHTQGTASGSTDALAWKQPVRLATAAAGTLASSFENGDTVDGVVLATGDRILIKNQAAGAENGIYTVNASGAPTRATDADTGAKILGAAVYVLDGATQQNNVFILTNLPPVTLGTDLLAFAPWPNPIAPLKNQAGGFIVLDAGDGLAVGGVGGTQLVLDTHTHVSAGSEGGAKIYPTRLGTTPVVHDMAGANGTTTNNLNIVTTDGLVLRFTNAFAGSTNTITGIVAPTDNTAVLVLLVNDSLSTIVLAHASGSSSAGNRFNSSFSADFVLNSGGAVWIYYTSISGTACWEILDPMHTHNHSTNINGGQLTNTAISATAEIAVSKLADGAPLEHVRTDSAGTGVEWGPAPMVLLASSIVTGSSVATVDFSSIPATYQHLLICVSARTTAGAVAALLMTVNNDTGANYDLQILSGIAAAASATELIGQTSWTMIGLPIAANKVGIAQIFLEDYVSTAHHKTCIAPTARFYGTASGDLALNFRGGLWRNTAAINRVTFTPSAGNIDVGSEFTIYGIPKP